MVSINPKARRFEISSLKSRRRQAVEGCPYCGCNSLWAKSLVAWNWPINAPCSFCRGEVDGENQTVTPDGRRKF